jgi:hypothetical protein
MERAIRSTQSALRAAIVALAEWPIVSSAEIVIVGQNYNRYLTRSLIDCS